MGKKRGANAVSIFSGMGGLDLGLKKAGANVLIQMDYDVYCIETLKRNWKKDVILHEDVAKLSGEKILKLCNVKKKDVDLVVGGPSCQPFSRSNEGKRKGIKDARGLMIFEFGRIVREMRPKAFIMENVMGLLSSNEGRDFKKLLDFYKKLNYHVFHKVLNATEYGVPQKRKRLFLIGFRKKTDFEFPKTTHGDGKRLKPFVTTKDVIGDLDEKIIHDSKKTIGGKHGHLLNDIPPGKNYIYYTRAGGHKKPLFKDVSKFWTFLLKLDPNEPSTTIQAQPWDSVGPFHWNNRRLSLSEIKRIQDIPDEYFISGEKGTGNEYGSPAWMQIGNAVPPKLAEVVARQVIKHLD